MLTLIEDTVGKHDLLLPACRPDMNRLLYGKHKDELQDTCYDNMSGALEPFGAAAYALPICHLYEHGAR